MAGHHVEKQRSEALSENLWELFLGCVVGVPMLWSRAGLKKLAGVQKKES
jgi:hypothetical protein